MMRDVPARSADDVSLIGPRILSGANLGRDDGVAWLAGVERGIRRGRASRRTPLAATAVLGLAVSLGLPQAAFAPASVPAAQAHDRIDLSPGAARALAAASEAPADWNGLPVAEQQPATTALVEGDLAQLPRVTREAVRFGPRSVPRTVVDTIVQASSEAGVDPVYMMALADKESSFDTDAKAATSSAKGLFQFIATTWLEMIRDHGARYGLTEEAAAVRGRGPTITVASGMRERVLALRDDPRVAALMAAELIKRDRGRIEARVGRALSTAELYLAHLLGRADAGRFLALSSERPDETAAREFRSAARTNRSLFTAADGSRRRNLTVAELHGRIGDMIDRRLSRYQGVTALAEAIEGAAGDGRRVDVADAQVPGGV